VLSGLLQDFIQVEGRRLLPMRVLLESGYELARPEALRAKTTARRGFSADSIDRI
jgi:hypothetical protein